MLAALAGFSPSDGPERNPRLTRAAAPAFGRSSHVAWTLKTKQDIRWQQITPAGTLLISTDAALMGVDIERGQVSMGKARSSAECPPTAFVLWRDRSSWRQPGRDCS